VPLIFLLEIQISRLIKETVIIHIYKHFKIECVRDYQNNLSLWQTFENIFIKHHLDLGKYSTEKP